jgi:hypothetical protein
MALAFYRLVEKNGHPYTDKQHHQCKACGRQCVSMAEHRLMTHEQRTLIERLRRECL